MLGVAIDVDVSCTVAMNKHWFMLLVSGRLILKVTKGLTTLWFPWKSSSWLSYDWVNSGSRQNGLIKHDLFEYKFIRWACAIARHTRKTETKFHVLTAKYQNSIAKHHVLVLAVPCIFPVFVLFFFFFFVFSFTILYFSEKQEFKQDFCPSYCACVTRKRRRIIRPCPVYWEIKPNLTRDHVSSLRSLFAIAFPLTYTLSPLIDTYLVENSCGGKATFTFY